MPSDVLPTQTDGLTLRSIASKIADKFGLKVVVDDSVSSVCGETIASTSSNPTETAKQYLSSLAGQRNVILSHTPKGELLLTGYKTKEAKTVVQNYQTDYRETMMRNVVSVRVDTNIVNVPAVFSFSKGLPGIEMELVFDGQKMHSDITVKGQSPVKKPDDTSGSASDSTVTNPYVYKKLDYQKIAFDNTVGNKNPVPYLGRPRVEMQTSGTSNTTPKSARNLLSEELQSIQLRIEMHGWDFNGRLAMPGDIITVVNDDLHIYSPARFIIDSIEYRCPDAAKEIAILYCVVPESFNNDTPQNIFG
jgi:prophage tail gpP-like protein